LLRAGEEQLVELGQLEGQQHAGKKCGDLLQRDFFVFVENACSDLHKLFKNLLCLFINNNLLIQAGIRGHKLIDLLFIHLEHGLFQLLNSLGLGDLSFFSE
jgi:hypothetical protein